MSSPQFSKREVLRFLLEQLTPVRILLDARREGVQVPQKFRSAPQLILEIGYRMNPPIVDLDIEGDAVRCTLSFSKQPFYCVLPWSSIWALIGKHDGRGCQWVEDIPPEAMAIQQLQPPRMPPVLRSISTKKDEPAEAKADESPRPAEEAKAAEAPKTEAAEAPKTEAAEAAKTEAAEAPETEAAEAAKTEVDPAAKAAEGEARAAEAAPDKAAPDKAAPDKAEDKAKAEEIYEEPPARPDGKKKRELPSYLRVIK